MWPFLNLSFGQTGPTHIMFCLHTEADIKLSPLSLQWRSQMFAAIYSPAIQPLLQALMQHCVHRLHAIRCVYILTTTQKHKDTHYQDAPGLTCQKRCSEAEVNGDEVRMHVLKTHLPSLLCTRVDGRALSCFVFFLSIWLLWHSHEMYI